MRRREAIRKQQAKFIEENGVICLDNVSKSYSTGSPALNGISLKVHRGEFVFIVGDSGSGKSTLLNCIAAVIQPTGGSIAMNGRRIETLKGASLADYRGKEIGYLFQNFELLDNLTGCENILLPLSLHGVPEHESKKRLEQLASYLEIKDILDKFPAQMSGGQKQKIAFARALIQDRPIMVLDEVTSNLDICAELQIKELIKNEFKRKTIILITHKTELLEDMDQIFLIKEGKLKLLSDKKQVFDSDCRKKLIAELEK